MSNALAAERGSTMRFISEIVGRKPVFIKMALSYIVLGALLISVFAVLLTGRVKDDMVSEIKEHTEQTIYQSYSTADILLRSTYDYFYQVFERDGQVFEGLYGKQLERITYRNINARLMELLQTNPLVDSIYIYNFQDDLVFSTRSPSMPMKEFYDREMTELVQSGGALTKGYPYLSRKEQFSYLNKTYDKNLISILYANTVKDSYSHGVMVVNLNQTVFQELVSKVNTNSAFTSMIIDKQGKIISHPESSTINTNLGQEAYIQTILNSPQEKGDFLAQVGGKMSFVTYMKSDRFGWSFVGVSEYEGLISKANMLNKFIGIITFIFIVLSIITGGFFTNRFYKPIRMLLKQAGDSQEPMPDGKAVGEYELLSRSFDHMRSTISSLRSDLRKHMPESKKSLLSALLSGDLRSSKDLVPRLEQTGVRIKQGRMQTGVVRIDRYSQLMKQYGIGDVSLLKYAAMNIAEEIVGKYGNAELLEDEEASFILIWNLESEEAKPAIEPILLQISEQIRHYLKLSVTIGVGTSVESLERLSHSWSSASQAARYRLVYGQGKVLVYDRIQLTLKREYEYPLQLEKTVTDYLKAGDLSRLNAAFTQFLEHIHGFRFDEMVLALNQLMVMTLRTAMEMVDDSSQEWMLELQDIHNQLRMHDTLEEIAEWYAELCRRIVEIRSQKASGKSREQVQSMLQYIQEHYGDPNVSVELLAAHVGFSTNHARKVFKEHTGHSLSVYLSEYRYEKAKELLLETELPANRIGEMVGITNPSYFYVSFKKYAGKTPDHFRKAERLKS